MHELEPFYNWQHIYISEEDERSPFLVQSILNLSTPILFIIIISTLNGIFLAAERFT